MTEIRTGTLTLDNSQALASANEVKTAVSSVADVVDQAGQSIEKNTTRLVSQTNEFKRLAAAIPDTTAALSKVEMLVRQMAASDMTAAQRAQFLTTVTQGRVSGTLDLAKAMDLEAKGYTATAGAIRQYADTVAASGGAAGAAAGAVSKLDAAHGNMNLRVQEAMHSVRGFTEMVLAGQNPLRAFSMEAGRATSVLLQMDGGFKSLLISAMPVLAPIVAVAAAVGAFALASSQVREGQKAVADSLKTTGDAAGISAGGVEMFAERMGAAGDVTTKQARSMAAAFIQAGVSLKEWAALAPEVQGFARLTGTDLVEAQKQLAEAVGGPIQKFVELDQKYNLVSDAQLQQIRNLQAQGRETEAQALKVQALTRFEGDHQAVAAKWPGLFEGMERGVNRWWDALGRIGQADPLGKQIEAQKAKLIELQRLASGPLGGQMAGSVQISQAQSELASLQAQKAAEDAKIAAEAHAMATQVEGKAADELARSYDSTGTETQKLTNDIALMSKALADGAGNTDLLTRSLDAARNKLRELQSPGFAVLQEIASQGRILGAGPAGSLERSQQTIVEQRNNALRQQGQPLLNDTQVADIKTSVAAGAQDELLATNKALEQQAQLQKLLAAAAGGTAEAQAKAQRTQALYNEALKVGGVEVAQAVLDGKPLPPMLQQTAEALARVDFAKFGGANAKAATDAQIHADAQHRLAEAAGQGDAALRAATYANQQEAASHQGAAAVIQATIEQRTAEADAILKYTNETVSKLDEQTTANNTMAGAVGQGQAAVEAAARAEFSRAQILALGKDALVAGTKAQEEYNRMMTAFDANVASGKNLAGSGSLKDQQDKIALLQQELTLGSQHLAQNAEQIARAQALADIEGGRVKIAEDQKQQYVDQAGEIARMTQQVSDVRKAEEARAKAFQKATEDITRFIGEGLAEAMQKPGDAWTKTLNAMHAAFRNFLAQLAAEAIAKPIIISVLSSAGGGGSGGSAMGDFTGGGGGGGSSLLGTLMNYGSTASSISGMFGGPSIGGYISSLYEGSALQAGIGSISASLFGTAAASGGAVATGAVSTASTITLADGTVVPLVASTPAAGGMAGATIGGETAGTLGSGGAGGAAGFSGGAFAGAGPGALAGGAVGYGVGTLTHSPGISAASGAVAGAAVGSIGGPIGAAIGAVVGAIVGALSGQHPTVGPNATSVINGWDKTTQLASWSDSSDNGGSTGVSGGLMQQSVAALTAAVHTLGGTINNLPPLAMGYFKGNYFLDDTRAGGTGTYSGNTFSDPNVATGEFMRWVLQRGDISGLSDDVKTTIAHLSPGTTAQDIGAQLGFANEFQDALKAMKSGVEDYTKAVNMAADDTAQNLIKQIQDFRDMTTKTGLSLDDANAALKQYATAMLDPPKQQQSQLSLAIQQTTANFKSMQAVLVNVGYSADDAAKLINDKLTAALDSLKQQGAQTLIDVINQYADPAQYKLGQIGAQGAQWYKDAKDLGISKDLVDQAVAVQEAQVYQQTFNDAKTAYTNAIDAQISAIQTQISSTQALVSAMDSLRQAANDNLTSDLSTLSPLGKLDAAKSQYDAALAAVNAATTPDQQAAAMQALQGAGQNYLKIGQQYYASSPGYAAIFDRVQVDYNKFATMGLTMESQEQTLQNQLTTLNNLKSATDKYGTKTTASLDALNKTMTDAYTIWQNELTTLQGLGAKTGINTGGTNGTTSNPNTSATVTGLYNGLLGRGADSGGLAGWTTQLNNGASEASVVTDFLTSSEYQSQNHTAADTVSQLYQTVLGRSADAAGAAAWTDALSSGGMSIGDVVNGFFNSSEYLASHSHAKGGIAAGLSLVGEQGPELVYAPPSGAQVFTASQTRSILSGANDNSIAQELRQLRADNKALNDRLCQVLAALGDLQAAGFGETVSNLRAMASGRRLAAAKPATAY